MPIYSVQAEDGKIIKVEAPEGTPETDILSFAKEQYSAMNSASSQDNIEQQPTMSQGDAAAFAITKGFPFAGDAAAYIASQRAGVPFDVAKKQYEEQSAAGREQYPLTSLAGNVVGSLPIAAITPNLMGKSLAESALRGASILGGQGALYGLGEGVSGGDRISNAVANAALLGLAGGGFGIAGGIGTGLAVKGTGLLERAKAVFKGGGKPRDAAGSPMGTSEGRSGTDAFQSVGSKAGPDESSGINQSGNATQSVESGVLPLTKGQETGDVDLQRTYNQALNNVYGEEARSQAMAIRDVQSQKGKDFLSGLANSDLQGFTPSSKAGDIIDSFRDAYKVSKEKTREAYAKFGDINRSGEMPQISTDFIKNTLIPSFKEWASTGGSGTGFNIEGLSPRAKDLYKQATSPLEKVKSVDFHKGLEHWRQGVTQEIGATQDPSTKAFLSGLLKRYDDGIEVMTEDAVLSGDKEAFKKIVEARSLRSEQGKVFEKPEFVDKIISTQKEMTPEQFVNSIDVLGSRSGVYVKNMLNSAKKAGIPELQKDLRSMYLQNVLNKSLSQEMTDKAKPEVIDKLISFSALSKNIDNLLKNETLSQSLFSSSELGRLRRLSNYSKKIAEVKTGTLNKSGTAYEALNILRNVMGTPAAAVSGLTKVAASIERGNAMDVLKSDLSNIINSSKEAMKDKTFNFVNKYGSGIIKTTAQPLVNQAQEPLKITIRPRREK